MSLTRMPSSSTSSCQPVAMAALANCSSRMSRWDRWTEASLSPPRLVQNENARSVASDGQPGGELGCDSPRLLLPERIGPIGRATRPERARRPRRRGRNRRAPTGSTSPITPSSMPSSRSRTTSIAPSAARMPQAICAASNAGPAGAAVQTSPSAEPSATSQFVPTSIKRRSRLSRVMPLASRPATMSPPTYAPSAGKTLARAPGCNCRPSSVAGISGYDCVAMMKGATPIGSGSTPSAMRGHRRVAGKRDLVHLRGVDPALGADLLGELLQRLGGEAAEALEGVRVEHRRGDAGDHVRAERLLLVQHRSGRPPACLS